MILKLPRIFHTVRAALRWTVQPEWHKDDDGNGTGTQVSPYHMALITSAIANGGKLMKPYLVDKVTTMHRVQL